MDIFFICLANSYKYGGRCIAGVEISISNDNHWSLIRNENGCPRWVRPIATDTEYGEIPEGEARFINILSIVKLTNIITCPNQAHSEDVYYKMIKAIGVIPPEASILNLLLDNFHPNIFYTTDYFITPGIYAQGNYSLMMIHPDDFTFRLDPSKNRAKYYMIFHYNGAKYDLSITDPYFYHYLENHPKAIEQLEDVYLTLSISMEYEGRHHKLIAAVIIPNEKQIQNDLFLIHHETLKKRSERRFTFIERLAYKKTFAVQSQQGPSVYMKMWNGKERFIQLEEGISIQNFQKISLQNALLITYEDLNGNTIERIRIITK